MMLRITCSSPLGMLHRGLIAASVLALATGAATAVGGCGTSVIEAGDHAGGSGGGGGSAGAPVHSACEDLEGAYTLRGGTYYLGAPPWVALLEQDQSCSAVVACTGHPGRPYTVTLSDTAVVLEPAEVPATGGHSSLTDHHLTDWERITLDRQGSSLSGTATAEIVVDWNEEDIWGVDSYTETRIVEDAEPGMLEASTTLPWRPQRVIASQPVAELGSSLSLPGGEWTATDEVPEKASGVMKTEVQFSGSWDDVRGQTVTLDVDAELSDLAGVPLASSTIGLEFYDIGPAIGSHDMSDLSTVAHWGFVEIYAEGECATLGCVQVRGNCGTYAGIAGQLDTTGATDVVLSMRLLGSDQWYDEPAVWDVQVVDEDGTRITPTNGGGWLEQAEQQWVYPVSGQDRVGFAIQVTSYCHGWGGPIIVDAVTAQ